jgi:hypothetical protein
MPPEDEVINGSIGITEADLTRGIQDHSAFFRLRWFMLVMFAAASAVVLFSGMAVPLSQFAPQGLCFAFICTWAFVSPRLSARKMLRTLVKAGDNQILYRFDAEGGTVRASGATSTFAYRVLTRVRESATTLHLTFGSGATTLIPKRAFSPADLARLQALLAQYVKNEKTTGSGRALKLVFVWLALVFAFVVIWQFLNAR